MAAQEKCRLGRSWLHLLEALGDSTLTRVTGLSLEVTERSGLGDAAYPVRVVEGITEAAVQFFHVADDLAEFVQFPACECNCSC